MKTRTLFTIAILVVGSLAKPLSADDYEFDWNSSRDMSGAFFICSLTAFTFNDGADCPRVLYKCMTDPSLLEWTWKGPKSKCLDLASFVMSGEDATAALEEAANRTGSDVNVEQVTEDFSSHASEVVDTVEQDGDPNPEEYEGYVEGGYSGTVYAHAENATASFVDSDYFDFYYVGDGNSGGWGHPEYQKDYYIENFFEGMSASEAYDAAYEEAFIAPASEPADTYEERHSAAIAVAIAAAVSAENAQREVIHNEYSRWRRDQPWDSFGYGLEAFKEDYNVARTQAFYNAFVEAGSVPGCDMNCATAAGESAAENYPLRG